jgi:hypothetical protein
MFGKLKSVVVWFVAVTLFWRHWYGHSSPLLIALGSMTGSSDFSRSIFCSAP